LELGIEAKAYDLGPERSSERWGWGKWSERRKEFYARCGELVSDLPWSEVVRICGVNVRARSEAARDAYHRIGERRVPDRLRLHVLKVLPVDTKTVGLAAYSEFHPLGVSQDLMAVLPHFDGRKTKDVVRSLATEHNVKMDEALIRRLVDFRVLVDVDEDKKT
jgi:hypothetical protein